MVIPTMSDQIKQTKKGAKRCDPVAKHVVSRDANQYIKSSI